MGADWLIAVAWLRLALAFACAAVIVAAVWFHRRYGRPTNEKGHYDRARQDPPGLGLTTAYPVKTRLVGRGTKEAM